MPTEELCLLVMGAFGLTGFDDIRCFTRKDMEIRGTITKLHDLLPIITSYYLPCKARSYLSDLNCKNGVTVLRHFVRIFGYKVHSKEKYIKGEKIVMYNVKNINQETSMRLAYNKKNGNCTLEFD